MIPKRFKIKFIELDGVEWAPKHTFFSTPESVGMEMEMEIIEVRLTKKDNQAFSMSFIFGERKCILNTETTTLTCWF